MPDYRLSDDLAVRVRGDRILLHNAAALQPPVETRDPVVVAFVLSFRQPQSPETLVARMPNGQRDAARQLIRQLQERGLLVPGDHDPARRTAAERKDRALQGLAQLAVRLHALHGDLAALPAAAWTDSDAGADDRVQSLINACEALATPLRAMAQTQVRAERAAMSDSPAADINLLIGGGDHAPSGWINLDAGDAADLHANIDRGLPFADGECARIHAAHVLEHLFHPGPALALLRECHRVLRPGGRLRLIVPDIQRYLEAYCANDAEFFAARRAHWQQSDAASGTLLEQVLHYAGAGNDPGDVLHSHKFGYDATTLTAMLNRAGFSAPITCKPGESADPQLSIDAHSFAAQAEHAGQSLSLIMEAEK